MDFHEILTNREAYPDDRTLDLGNGQTVTLKQFRDAVIPKGEMTKLTQQYSERERQLQQAVQGYQTQLEQALRDKGATPANPTAGLSEAELINDPVLGPILRRQAETDALLKQVTERLDTGYRTFLADRGTRALEAVTAKIPMDRQALVDRTEQLLKAVMAGEVPFETVARAAHYDDAVTKARQEGEAAGIEKGRKEGRLPTVPMGGARMPRDNGSKAETWEAAEQEFVQSEDFRAIVEGASSP